MSAEYQNDLIKCELCGRSFKSITNSHLRDKHNMTTKEYKEIFPNSKMLGDYHWHKLSQWVYSEKNSDHFRRLQQIQKDSEKRKSAVRTVTQSELYRKSHSELMKRIVRENPDTYKVMWSSISGPNHHHYGKSNWQRWFEKYGKDEADRRLLDWKQKNKIPGGSKNTKVELKVKSIFDLHSIQYIHQFDRIEGMYNDFYLPEYNLIFEVDGDYWHANPKLYTPNEVIKYPGNRFIPAKNRWKYDSDRDSIIKSLGYNVTRIFESDVTEENVLSLINNFDKDIVRTYEKL